MKRSGLIGMSVGICVGLVVVTLFGVLSGLQGINILHFAHASPGLDGAFVGAEIALLFFGLPSGLLGGLIGGIIGLVVGSSKRRNRRDEG